MPGPLRLLTGLAGKTTLEESELSVYLPAETEQHDGTAVVYQTIYAFIEDDIPETEVMDRSLDELSQEYEALVKEYGSGFVSFVAPDPTYREVRVWGQLVSQYTEDKAGIYPFDDAEQSEVRRALFTDTEQQN